MQTFEEKFRAKFPDSRVEIEPINQNCERFRVYVGKLECSESLNREFAFRWALEDTTSGLISIPAQIEQVELPL